MPELPEVETIVRRLRVDVGGKRLVQATLLWPRLIARPDAATFLALVEGRRIEQVGRRGKYILFGLEGGWTWLVHLRMTGRFLYLRDGAPLPEEKHLRFLARFEDGSHLLFINPRKFARFTLVRDAAAMLASLGPEPLSPHFTEAVFAAGLRGRRQPIKPLLLSQRVVAGLGNIYTCEALWRAGIDPRRAGGSLTAEEIARLRAAIIAVLEAAVQRGGSTLGDGQYLTPDGARGEAQHALAVYGKAGQPCPRCGTPIVRFVQGGRSTYACPRCQQ